MARVNGWFDSDPDPPGTPSGLVLAAVDGAIEVVWTAPAGTDSDGFGYRVGWKLADDEWAGVSEQSALVDGSLLSYTITGMTNDIVYDVRVRAFNDGGGSSDIEASATPLSR